VLRARHDHRPHDGVDGLLVEAAEGGGGGPGALYVAVEALGEHGVHHGSVEGWRHHE